MDDKFKVFKEKFKDPGSRFLLVLLAGLVIISLWSSISGLFTSDRMTISYSEFLDQLNSDNISSVVIKDHELTGEFKKETDINILGGNTTVKTKSFQPILAVYNGYSSLDIDHRYMDINNARSSANTGWTWRIVYLWAE
jgi:ATP-dependent Zn protease